MRLHYEGELSDALVFVCADDEMPHFRASASVAEPPWEMVTPVGSSCALAKCPKCGALNIGEFCCKCGHHRAHGR